MGERVERAVDRLDGLARDQVRDQASARGRRRAGSANTTSGSCIECVRELRVPDRAPASSWTRSDREHQARRAATRQPSSAVAFGGPSQFREQASISSWLLVGRGRRCGLGLECRRRGGLRGAGGARGAAAAVAWPSAQAQAPRLGLSRVVVGNDPSDGGKDFLHRGFLRLRRLRHPLKSLTHSCSA